MHLHEVLFPAEKDWLHRLTKKQKQLLSYKVMVVIDVANIV